jgi:hypothetical protein
MEDRADVRRRFDPAQHQHQLRCRGPRTMRCHPSPVEAVTFGSAAMVSPTSATTRSALGQPAELGGVRPLRGSHVGSSFPTNPAPAQSSPRHR